MSQTPTRRIAGSIGRTACTAHAGNESQSDDLAVLLEALRRLKETENEDQIRTLEHVGGGPSTAAGDDDGVQVLASGVGGAFHGADHLYPLNLDELYHQAGDHDGASNNTAADDFIPLDGLYGESGRYSGLINDDDVISWDVVSLVQQWHSDGVVGHLGGLHTAEAAASGDDHGDRAESDLINDDDGDEISRDIVTQGLHIPHIQATTTPLSFFVSTGGEESSHGGDGFGAVPASAAAIAGLKKRKYDGSGDDTACVICMREYKKGRTLHVMPCTRKHRFHRKCLRKWLARSNQCPLCRHALPAAQQGVNGSTILRINVSTR